MNVFFAADLHLNHEKVITFGIMARRYPTIQAHDAAVTEKWNKVVRPRDRVWVLGDVYLGGTAESMKEAVRKLNGNKHLIIGNSAAPGSVTPGLSIG